MSDQYEQQQQGFTPMTSVEVDCSTSAKGDVNVSWKVKVQLPTEAAQKQDIGIMVDALGARVASSAAGLKVAYISCLKVTEMAEAQVMLAAMEAATVASITDQEYAAADAATEAELEAEAEHVKKTLIEQGIDQLLKEAAFPGDLAEVN